MLTSQMLQALLTPKRRGIASLRNHPPGGAGTLADPGTASALGPTIPMRVGATLNPMLERVQDIFPKDNPYGTAIENFVLGDSPERTGRMAEGIPHQYTGAGPNDPAINPAIMDLAGALPIGSAATLAKAAAPFVKATAVPAGMFAASRAVEPLLGISASTKIPNSAVTSMDDIGAALLGQSLQRQGALDDLMVTYHGSPHEFDALDPTKIGTGEGAQAYGHGAYVAESKHVAQTYQPRDFDAEEIMMAKYKEAEARGDYNRMEQWENAMLHETPDDLRERSLDMDYDEDYRQAAAEVAEELAAIPSTSHLYEIDVPDEDIAKMLDWDAPLDHSDELPKQIIEDFPDEVDDIAQLTGAPNSGYEGDPDSYGDIYQWLSRKLGGQKQASEYLASKGIPGIKYYDKGSRAAEEGTRNMVLFDELARRAKVLKRNDETIAQPSVDEFIGGVVR